MKGRNFHAQLVVLVTMAVLAAVPALAAPHSLATVHAGSSSIEWQPAVAGVGMVLTVSGPHGFYLRQEVQAGESATFSVFDKAGQLRSAGQYAWELTPVVQLDPATAHEAEAARQAGEPGDAGALQKAAELPAVPKLQSGSFAIAGQAIVAGGDEEPGAGKPAAPTGNRLATKDQVIADDLIVQGSECVGFDCVNNESFGFDTIRLKENNTRIKFEDTSVGSFPSTDWQLTANDSANGGANKFSIEDVTDAKVPLTITGNAPTNSIFVDSTGRVGLGTATPVLNLHIASGNTPALRLEQNNSSGFAAQTFDIAGNEANFFVRDVTGGSKLPFRIRPGAPTSSIDIAASGNVGIGTASPSASLHVKRTDGTAQVFVDEGNSTSAQRTLLKLENLGPPAFTFQNDSGTGSWSFFHANNDRFVISRDGTGNQEFAVAPNGDVFVNGVMVHSSSRTKKEDFSPVDPQEVLAKVDALPVTSWSYKKDNGEIRHLGPMAEDFSAAFGLGSDDKYISDSDTAGVALAAIKGLNKVVEQKDQEIQDLKARLAKLEAVVDQLSQKE